MACERGAAGRKSRDLGRSGERAWQNTVVLERSAKREVAERSGEREL